MPLAIFLVLGLLPATAATLSLDVSRPVPGYAGSEPAPLAGFLRELDMRPGQSLIIRHAGGEQGSNQAASLRDWLVARGVPSSRIRLEPAAAAADQLILEILKTEEVRP